MEKIVSSERSRITYIDWLETMAIFLVVCCHYAITAGEGVWQNVIFQLCTTIAVPVFFMVNGSLLLNHSFDLKKHIIKTAFFIIATVLWKLIYLITVYYTMGFEFASIEPLDLFNYFCGANLYEPYIPAEHFWYMYSLIGIYLIFPVIKALYDSKFRNVYKYFMILIFVFFFLFSEVNEIMTYLAETYNIPQYMTETFSYTMLPLGYNIGYLFYFMLGPYMHSKFYEQKDRFDTKHRIIMFLIMYLSFMLILIQKIYQEGTLDGEWVSLNCSYTRVTTCVMACAAYAFFASLEYKNKVMNSFNAFISKRTMNIYCLHMLLCYLYEKLIYAVSPWQSIGLHIVKTIVIIAVSLIITEPFTWVPGVNKALGVSPIHRFRKKEKI